MSDLIGKSLGRYHILEQLGEGGMATVYKAYDTRLETDVAVKVIRTENLAPSVLERSLKRFEREAKALARLTHPNIVKVTDYGEYEGKPYLVMEYLPGGTLKQKLGKPLEWQEVIHILLPIARALDFAHRQSMIHRDVKPANILITADGEPMLTDFGIAKIIDEEATQDLTGTSAAIGTPEYMAPEQATAKSVDKRADIYAFGVVLYEMLTGRKPFIADTPMAVLIKHAIEPLPRPSQFVRDLPPRLEQILLKALAKNREDRYQSMGELVNALEEMAQNTRTVKQTPRPPARNAPPTITEKIPALPPSPDYGSPTGVLREGAGGEGNAWRKWISLGALVILLGIAIAIGNGILGLGTRGMGPLAGLATDTLTPTLTSTPTLTLTPTKTPVPTATFTPTPGIGSTWARPADGMLMMFVPAGEFTMGSENGSTDESPIHTVTLDAYWIDQTEVTNQMYALCAQAGTCQPPEGTRSYTHSSYYGNPEYDNFPVIYVDWDMAKTYCEWAGARLPTEAEWEKAARGTDGRTYPWGEGLDCNKANYFGCVGDTIAVGSYDDGKSPYGLSSQSLHSD